MRLGCQHKSADLFLACHVATHVGTNSSEEIWDVAPPASEHKNSSLILASVGRAWRNAVCKMILYYSPGACSLASHIALHDAGKKFDLVKVDLKTHRLDDGRAFTDINPRGYVPALQLDNGELLSENIAVLSMIADLTE